MWAKTLTSLGLTHLSPQEVEVIESGAGPDLERRLDKVRPPRVQIAPEPDTQNPLDVVIDAQKKMGDSDAEFPIGPPPRPAPQTRTEYHIPSPLRSSRNRPVMALATVVGAASFIALIVLAVVYGSPAEWLRRAGGFLAGVFSLPGAVGGLVWFGFAVMRKRYRNKYSARFVTDVIGGSLTGRYVILATTLLPPETIAFMVGLCWGRIVELVRADFTDHFREMLRAIAPRSECSLSECPLKASRTPAPAKLGGGG